MISLAILAPLTTLCRGFLMSEQIMIEYPYYGNDIDWIGDCFVVSKRFCSL